MRDSVPTQKYFWFCFCKGLHIRSKSWNTWLWLMSRAIKSLILKFSKALQFCKIIHKLLTSWQTCSISNIIALWLILIENCDSLQYSAIKIWFSGYIKQMNHSCYKSLWVISRFKSFHLKYFWILIEFS